MLLTALPPHHRKQIHRWDPLPDTWPGLQNVSVTGEEAGTVLN